MTEQFVAKLLLDRLDFSQIEAILELGAFDGRNSIYLANKFPNARVLAIEGNPDFIGQIRDLTNAHSNIVCVEAVVSDVNKLGTFYQIDCDRTITPRLDGNPGAAGIFCGDLGNSFERLAQVPIDVETQLLSHICDEYKFTHIDLICMDISGAELKALIGLGRRLNEVKYIWTKVNHRPQYLGQPLFPELNLFLSENGFDLITPINPDVCFEYLLYRRANFKIMPRDAVTISQPWGGLGDNLSFSTLPELFNNAGRTVFISRENICRNQEIENLVWTLNPFIHGISTATPNAGSVTPLIEDSSLPFVSRIEASHGLNSSGRSPKIYCRPKKIKSLSGKNIIDFSATGLGGGAAQAVKNVASKFFENAKLDKSSYLQIKFSNIAPNNNLFIDDFEVIDCHSLEEYCSILYSCNSFVTVHSGAHSLGVAIRSIPEANLKRIVCIVPEAQMKKGLFIFEDVEYLVTPSSFF